MTKILHILPFYYRNDQYSFEDIANAGGGERYAAELALAVSRYRPTTLITFGERNATFFHEDLTIKVIKREPFWPRFNGKSNFLYFGLYSLMKEFDIIHAHKSLTDTTVFACVFGKMLPRRVFTTDLGFSGLNIARFFPVYRLATSALVLSKYDEQRLRLPSQKLHIIYGGVDLRKYRVPNVKKHQVIFIGRILPHKGVNYLIDAIDKDTRCIIAGHAYDSAYLKYLKKISKNKKITFLLDAKDEAIIKHLEESKVLVLPSVDVDVFGEKHKNPELFGLVIAEAFATGTPAIVSDSSALPYVVDNNVNGFVVRQNNASDIREKINTLLNNEKLFNKMSHAARKKTEDQYNWDLVAKKCIQIYEEA